MSTLPELGRRLSRKIEQRKTIQLSPDDLDLLVLSGAYEVIWQAVAEHQRKVSHERLEARREQGQSSNGGADISDA